MSLCLAVVWGLGRSGSLEPMDVQKLSEGRVHDQFDVSLEDADLLGEVELTTNLIIAASECDEHLSQTEIDAILGVVPSPRAGS